MFEYCSDPSTLDTFRWFGCYLTNGAHFLFYQSFLVVFALLAVTAPAALAFGFAAAAASRSHILPLSWLGKIYTAMVRGVPDIVFFLFFILVLDQAIEYLRHSVVCPDWTEEIRQGANFIVCPEARTPQSGAPQWVHETYGFALAVFTYAIVFGAFCGNVLYGAMRAVPRPQLETAEAYGMTRRQVFWRILVPQMWIYALPGLVKYLDDPDQGHAAPVPPRHRGHRLLGPRAGRLAHLGLPVPAPRLALLVLLRASGLLPRLHPRLRDRAVADHGAAVARTGHGGGRRDAEGGGMTCAEAIQAYAFRAIGFGERLLPRTDIGVCEQVVLIGSGMIWNIYFAVLALGLGFFFAVLLAVAKASPNLALRKPAEWFIFVFRGSPLFIQFFMAYEAFVLLPRIGVEFELFGVAIEAETRWFARAWLGALIVLWLNTAAYSAEIFYGALRSVPKGDLEAADAYGLTGWKKFRRITFPTTMRLAWPAYTNEAIFLFHSTALVFFSSFPAFQQRGDALYYANYFADRTFNPFIPYPIVAIYFVLFTLLIIALFGAVNKRLNRHLPQEARPRLRYRPQVIR
jgi:polar amino acid transport system permease protein